MITVIRGSLFSLFDYWKKPVPGCPGRSSQNDLFIVVIGTQCWFILSSKHRGNGFQGENSQLITDHRTPAIFKIPIVLRHTEIPCLRPAVSSLGACPTPAL